ncbi:hypothetical protein VPH35_079019 [Triticum aestivum]
MLGPTTDAMAMALLCLRCVPGFPRASRARPSSPRGSRRGCSLHPLQRGGGELDVWRAQAPAASSSSTQRWGSGQRYAPAASNRSTKRWGSGRRRAAAVRSVGAAAGGMHRLPIWCGCYVFGEMPRRQRRG